MNADCPICGNEIPFTITCEYCDAGQGLTLADVLGDGWTDIVEALDLPMANYIGTCPKCKSIHDMRPADSPQPPPALSRGEQ